MVRQKAIEFLHSPLLQRFFRFRAAGGNLCRGAQGGLRQRHENGIAKRGGAGKGGRNLIEQAAKALIDLRHERARQPAFKPGIVKSRKKNDRKGQYEPLAAAGNIEFMDGLRRNELKIAIAETRRDPVDPDLRVAVFDKKDLRHLAVSMRRNSPVMQARTVPYPFAMDDIGKGCGFAEEVEDRYLRLQLHARKVPFYALSVHSRPWL